MPAPADSSVRAGRKRRGDISPAERADRLTAREIEILQLTADGLSLQGVALRLDISPHTARTHVQNVLTKLGVHSKLEAITFAIRTGKVVLDPIPENGNGSANGKAKG